MQCACIFTAFSVPHYEYMKICIVSLLVDIWILFSIFAIASIAAVNVVSGLVHTYKGFSRVQTFKLLGSRMCTCSTLLDKASL